MLVSQFCVYTIRHTQELNILFEQGGTGEFSENKKWVTGKQLFEEARLTQERMPVVFAAAELIDGLIYYAWLTDIEIQNNGHVSYTIYKFEGLTPISYRPSLNVLRLKRTGEPLAENFIRPYAICYTPDFVNVRHYVTYQDAEVLRLPEEIPDDIGLPEGLRQRVSVNVYERNPRARRECILHYGTSCIICGFNFEERYGKVGAGLIHVHHLTPLSEIGEEYYINPINDLRPVCPNCHAIIHRNNPPYTIEEVITFLNQFRI